MARGVVVVVCSAASIASIGGHAAGRVRGSGTARVISAALAPARSATALRFISQASTAAAPSIAFFRITTGLNGTGALGDSGDASLSADGRFVTFTSDASNLVADPRHGSIKDVYVYDRATAQTTRESLGPSGAPATGASFAPVISTGGRFVAFWSVATDLVAPETEPGVSHVYVRDRQLAATTLVDVSSGGARGSGNAYQPAISSDGRFIAFWSLASNLVADDLNGCGDVFVRDLAAGTTERVSIPTPGFAPPCTFDSRDPSISADGRFVAFDGAATSAAPGSQLAVYVRDRATATTSLVSIDANSQPFRDFAFAPSINADGRFVVFQVNRPAGGSGLYMRDRAAGSTLGPLPGQFLSAHASADGRFVSYLTLDHDAFVIDAATGAVTAIATLASDVSAV
ncbi:MAG TPA: hypothetical protein VKE51_19725, partial [Vicinamibacterales bacterium]|nr:hypothetical protein [Vicinamibacterales bacterium]